uniref:Uncharacterized protein n=1 Tax=Lepeophtheirus salmonis TaxID=72036 RepID=A0A0K2T2V5_LEPSM
MKKLFNVVVLLHEVLDYKTKSNISPGPVQCILTEPQTIFFLFINNEKNIQWCSFCT